jgi:hypothetical protein
VDKIFYKFFTKLLTHTYSQILIEIHMKYPGWCRIKGLFAQNCGKAAKEKFLICFQQNGVSSDGINSGFSTKKII